MRVVATRKLLAGWFLASIRVFSSIQSRYSQYLTFNIVLLYSYNGRTSGRALVVSLLRPCPVALSPSISTVELTIREFQEKLNPPNQDYLTNSPCQSFYFNCFKLHTTPQQSSRIRRASCVLSMFLKIQLSLFCRYK